MTWLFIAIFWFISGLIGAFMYLMIVRYMRESPVYTVVRQFVFLGPLSVLFCILYILDGDPKYQRKRNRDFSNFAPFFRHLTFPGRTSIRRKKKKF